MEVHVGWRTMDALGVPFDANAETIRHVPPLARKYHPGGAGTSPDRFRAVRKAYQTLIDPD